ncbi:hypothetical protein MCHI_002342 [Candidatus Magnetoovum chiemensis]|nr:hypothetical protein MCHI_002342 [Candidatus Magnetoovum chiemensis]
MIWKSQKRVFSHYVKSVYFTFFIKHGKNVFTRIVANFIVAWQKVRRYAH